MLLLSEELLLLALIEKRYSVTVPASTSLPYAIAGAVLAELIFAAKLKIDEERRIEVVDATPGEDPLLNDVMEKIKSTPRPHKLKYWIGQLGSHSKRLYKIQLARLLEKGILREENKFLLWVIPYTEYSQLDASAKYWSKLHLRGVILGGEKLDDRSAALLGLLRACHMLKHVFTEDEIKAADKKIDELLKGEMISQAVIETLDEIYAAAATLDSTDSQ